MKIEGYQQSVGTGGVANGSIKVAAPALAYGGDGSGYAAMSKAYGQWAAAIEKQNEEEDKQNILNAMDIFNKSRYNIMYNDENGLMNTKLEGSTGISKSYSDQIDKARADVLGNIKLHSRKNQLALDHLMYNSAQEGFQTVDRWQTKQNEAVTDLRYSNNMQNYTEFAQKNWSDTQLLDNAIQGAKLTTDMVYGKRGKEFVEAKNRESVGAIVAGAVDASITHGDYDNSRKLLDQYGSLLNANQRAAFEKSIYVKEEGAFESDLAKRLVAQYGGDEAAIKAALEKEYAYSGSGGNESESFIAAISGQESGGDYNAKNGRTGASGKYQIMPKNWPEWSQEAGLPIGAEMTPENQEKVARFKLNQYEKEYGAEGAAVAWYAGPGNAERWVSGKTTDVWGNTWDTPQHGTEPSIKEYANSVMGRMKNGGSQKRLLNHDEQERILQDCRREFQAQQRQKQYQETQLYNTIKQDIFGMLQNGTSLSDAMAWAEAQAGSDVDRYTSYTNAVKSIYGAGGNSTSSGNGEKLGTMGRDALLDMLGSGAFTGKDKAYFLAYAANHGATNKDMDALDKGWDDWLNGAGQFAYDWNSLAASVMGKNDDARMKKGLIKGGKNFVRVYREQHNGMNPDESLIIEQMNKDVTSKVYGNYSQHRDWLPDLTFTVQGSNAQLYAAGIASVEKVGDDWYHVVWADGTDGNINGGYLQELISGGN